MAPCSHFDKDLLFFKFNDTHSAKLCLSQFSAGMVDWLPLTFFVCSQSIKFYTFPLSVVSGQLPPRKTVPRIITLRTIAPEEFCSRTISHEESYQPAHCPNTMKVTTKIITLTQANYPQRVLRVNWGKLCIVYEN